MSHQLSLSWLRTCLLSLLALALSLLFLLLHRTKAQHKQPSQLPSPSRLPLIGNLHQIGSLAHHSLRTLAQRHGPVMLLHFGRVPTVVVSSAKAAQEVMKTHDLVFSDRPASSLTDRLYYGSLDVAFAKYGDYWRQVRRVCVLHLLSAKQVQSFQPIREEEVALLVHRIRAASCQPVNISELIIAITTDIFCRVAFGRKHFTHEEGGGKRVHALLAGVMKVLGEFPMRDFLPCLRWIDWLNGLDDRVRKIGNEMDNFMEKVLEEHVMRKKNSTDIDYRIVDFVDILLSLDSVDGISLSKESMKAIIFDMFNGGIDTSFATMEWAMAELIKRPEMMRRAQEEVRRAVGSKGEIGEVVEGMELLQAVIKEILRLHPPGPLLVPRESMEDAQLLGYHIPKGTRVMINAWAIGRDPGSWEKPEEFWPERFFEENSVDFKGQDFRFIPFGAGRRGCPGIAFGIATVELILANLLYHFDWELPHGMKVEEVDMNESFGIIVHKKSSLVLVPKPRNLNM